MSSAPWAKFELKTLDRALGRPAERESAVLDAGFMPLTGKQGGFSMPQDVWAARMREAEERAAHLEREAYDKGFAQGERDGLELGRKKAEKIVSHMGRVLDELSGLKHHLAKVHERELLNMVLAVAKKIVRREVLRDETLIERTVLAALQLAADRSEISLRVHPDDVQTIETSKPGLFAQFKELKGLAVTSDPSVGRGGCVLESPCGDVDGRIENQLEQIDRVMDEAFRNQDP